MVRAVLFDAAGTLFRVRGSVGAAYAAVAARHGVALAAADIERRFRATFQAMPPMCFPGIGGAQLPQHERAWWRHVVRTAFADNHFNDFEAFFSQLFAHFARPESWQLFPDVVAGLASLLARGIRLAVVSNFDGRLADLCTGLGLRIYFETIVMSARVGYAKPDPRIFTIALERLGLRAGDVIHVGDSAPLDVAGARAAGIRAILIDRHTPAHTAACICDLRDLLRLI